MTPRSLRRWHGGLSASLALATAAVLCACTSGPLVQDLAGAPTGWVQYRSTWVPQTLRGRLDLPAASTPGRLPAVILVHGSAGVDDRGRLWSDFLRQHGVATFEIDYFGPRGVHASSREQPTPTTDVYDAMRLLATHPRIDASRIAVLGFSRGGYMSVRAADGAHRLVDPPARLVAAVGLYPPCGLLMEVESDPALPPVLLQVGDADEIAVPSTCVRIGEQGREKGRRVQAQVYEGAAHAWDGRYSGSWYHPAANRSYTFRSDAVLTRRSMQDVLEFLRQPLGLR